MTGESRRHRRERGGVTDSIGERERETTESGVTGERPIYTLETDSREKRVIPKRREC